MHILNKLKACKVLFTLNMSMAMPLGTVDARGHGKYCEPDRAGTSSILQELPGEL